MAYRVARKQPLVIRARDEGITIMSDQLPEGSRDARVDDIWKAQNILTAVEPDLIVLDLALPITVGTNLLKLLYESFPNVPVVTKIQSMFCEPHFFAIEPTKRGIMMTPLHDPPSIAT